MDHTGRNVGHVIPFMQDGSYFYKRGIEAYQNKHMAKSMQFIKRAIQVEPEEPVFLCQLAIILAEEGDYEASNHWLEKIKNEVDPGMGECYFFLANNQAHSGDFQEAKENLETYMKLDQTGDFQEDADALLYLIEVELGMEHTKADGTNPFNSPVMMKLHEGSFTEAGELAESIIKTKPESWHTQAMLAEAMWRQGEVKKAQKLLRQLLDKDEPDFLARCQYTVLLYETEDKEAARWVESLKNLYPLNRWDRYSAGRALYHVKEYEAAYLLLREAMPLDQPVYIHQLAVTAARCGKYRKARQLWKQAASIKTERQHHFLQMAAKAERSETAGNHRLEWLY